MHDSPPVELTPPGPTQKPRHPSALVTVLAFLPAFVLLVLYELRPNFPDPDSFYHAKMALILRDVGVIHQFPWMQWTTWRDHYVDPHFLYHVLLIPFVTLFDPLVGMKVSAIVFGLAAFAALYGIVRALRTPHPELFVLAAALSTGFLQRMALPRAPALSIALLLVATWFLRQRRVWPTAALAAVFVWFYHGWPVLLLSLGALLVADLFAVRIVEAKAWRAGLVETIKRNGAIALATIGGLVFGMVVNPYFPDNLLFSVVDIIKIGIINYQTVLPVGQEWHASSLGELFSLSVPALLLFAFAFVFYFPGLARSKRRPEREELVTVFLFLFLAAGYLGLTLKSYRYIEYAIPFVLISAATMFTASHDFFRTELWPPMRAWLDRHPLALGSAVGFLSITLATLLASSVRDVTVSSDYYQATQYEVATQWIRMHVPPGETVFHNIWDFSMVLFYLDTAHTYIVGLDPTFMYDENPAAWTQWSDLSTGKDPDVSKIESVFHSRVVVVDTRFPESKTFEANLRASPLFTEVAQNEWVHVYADPSL